MKLTYYISDYFPEVFDTKRSLDFLSDEIAMFCEYPGYSQIDIDLSFFTLFDPTKDYTEFDHLCYTFMNNGVMKDFVFSISSKVRDNKLSQKIHFINVDESLADEVSGALQEAIYARG